MAWQRPSSSYGEDQKNVAPLSTKVLVQLHCFSKFYPFRGTGSSCIDCKAADATSHSLGSAQATPVQPQLSNHLAILCLLWACCHPGVPQDAKPYKSRHLRQTFESTWVDRTHLSTTSSTSLRHGGRVGQTLP